MHDTLGIFLLGFFLGGIGSDWIGPRATLIVGGLLGWAEHRRVNGLERGRTWFVASASGGSEHTARLSS